MSNAANTPYFRFWINSVSDELRVLRFDGFEAISKPFHYEVEVVCENPKLPLQDLLGQGALLSFYDQDDTEQRYVRGVITSGQTLEHRHLFTCYRFVVEPLFSLMQFKTNSRIFQKQTIPQIVQTLLEELGLSGDAFRFVAEGEHPVHEYCVQYQETDLNFVTRLLEEEGFRYYFEHTEDKHVLVLADGPAGDPTLAEPDVYYIERSGMVQSDTQTLNDFHVRDRMLTGGVALRDFFFEKPALNQHVDTSAERDKNLVAYYYPGDYQTPEAGLDIAKRKLEAYGMSSVFAGLTA